MKPTKETIKCRDIHGDVHKRPTSELQVRVSAYGVIIKDDKVLLIPTLDGHDFPGGGIEIDEMLIDGLEREVWEETGYKVKAQELVECGSSFFLLPGRDDHAVNSIVIYYTCKILSGEISTENFDEFEKEFSKAAEWLPLKDLKKIKFYNSVDSLAVIEKAKALKN